MLIPDLDNVKKGGKNERMLGTKIPTLRSMVEG